MNESGVRRISNRLLYESSCSLKSWLVLGIHSLCTPFVTVNSLLIGFTPAIERPVICEISVARVSDEISWLKKFYRSEAYGLSKALPVIELSRS